MTIQAIDIHLKNHHSLTFKYKDEYYTLRRKSSLLGPRYSFLTTEGSCQQRNSLQELCEQVYISDDTSLADAIGDIEVPGREDPAWETYNAVKHCAIVHGNEICFAYNGKYYWIAHTNDGHSHLSDDSNNTQRFGSCLELFEKARIEGKALKDIWKQVTVNAC